MPEFILDMGSPDGAKSFAALDDFTQGYVEAAFFTNTGAGDDEADDLEYATVGEFAESVVQILVEMGAPAAEFLDLAPLQ